MHYVNDAREARSARLYRIYKARPLARQRIILLPHASGSASFYRSWAELFPDSVEMIAVQYPGREDLIGEPMINDMVTLVGQLADSLAGLLDKPYVLFGHSMGGAVAYELYNKIAQNGQRLPDHLVISAIEPPSLHHGGDLHQQDDEILKQELSRLGGTGVDLEAFPDLAEMVMPLMRNDYRLIECYKPALPSTLINTPITAMIGDRDEELTLSEAQAWADETDQSFKLEVFAGGHFYLIEQKRAVVQALAGILEKSAYPCKKWSMTP